MPHPGSAIVAMEKYIYTTKNMNYHPCLLVEFNTAAQINVLNNYFTSVFTSEIPNVHSRNIPLSTAGIESLLSTLICIMIVILRKLQDLPS